MDASGALSEQEIIDLRTAAATMRSVLLTILDAVDYDAGRCRVNEMIGAVLPLELILKARKAAGL